MRKCRNNESNLVVVAHVFASGTAQALDQFLIRSRRSHLFMGHPFLKLPMEPSYCVLIDADGERHLLGAMLPPVGEPVRYFFDFLSTVWWLICHGPVDTVIGCGASDAFAGLVGRTIGRARRVVLYSIDYTPVRFRQPVLNFIFRAVERACVRHCDWVWNLSAEMAARRDRAWLRPGHGARQLIVPHGSGFDIGSRPRPAKEPATLAFVGHLLEKQGVQHVLAAMPTILESIPNARFVVMGTGPYEAELKAQAQRLGVEEHVEFTGYIADFGVIQNRLAVATLGVAPYIRELDTFTQFADPGKIKDYFAAGLPVITTSVPPIAAVVAAQGAGAVVAGLPDDIAAAVTRFLLDEKLHGQASLSALRLAEAYDWTRIFTTAFAESIDRQLSRDGRTFPLPGPSVS